MFRIKNIECYFILILMVFWGFSGYVVGLRIRISNTFQDIIDGFFDFSVTLQRTLYLPPDKKSRPELPIFLIPELQRTGFLVFLTRVSSPVTYAFACLNINPICYDEEAERIVELFNDQPLSIEMG